ncbi:MAG: hypothetical protein ACYCVW_16460 [Rhodocyclaceae bacterium]
MSIKRYVLNSLDDAREAVAKVKSSAPYSTDWQQHLALTQLVEAVESLIAAIEALGKGSE